MKTKRTEHRKERERPHVGGHEFGEAGKVSRGVDIQSESKVVVIGQGGKEVVASQRSAANKQSKVGGGQNLTPTRGPQRFESKVQGNPPTYICMR